MALAVDLVAVVARLAAADGAGVIVTGFVGFLVIVRRLSLDCDDREDGPADVGVPLASLT